MAIEVFSSLLWNKPYNIIWSMSKATTYNSKCVTFELLSDQVNNLGVHKQSGTNIGNSNDLSFSVQ